MAAVATSLATSKSAASTERKKNLAKYAAKAFDLPPYRRDFYDWTVCIDPKDIPKIRIKIRKLLRQFERIQFTSRRKQVYTFTTALFPMSHFDEMGTRPEDRFIASRILRSAKTKKKK